MSRQEAGRIFNALSEGGSITMPIVDQFWGDYLGSRTDRFGVNWMVNYTVFAAGAAFDDHPIQNDWNGSAKVALLSIDRSIDAWTTIASATSDDQAWRVNAELTQLRSQVEAAFPDARRFRQPGFDTLVER